MVCGVATVCGGGRARPGSRRCAGGAGRGRRRRAFLRRFERSGRRPPEGPGVGRAVPRCAEGVWGGVGTARRILEGPKQGARARKRPLAPERPENTPRGPKTRKKTRRGARTPPLPLILLVVVL